MTTQFYITVLIFITLLSLISVTPYKVQKEQFNDSMNIVPNNFTCRDYLLEKNPSLLNIIEGVPTRKQALQDLNRGMTSIQGMYDTQYSDLDVCVLDNEKKKDLYKIPETSCTFSNYVLDQFPAASMIYPSMCYVDPANSNFPQILDTMYAIKNKDLIGNNATILNTLTAIQGSNAVLGESLSNINSQLATYQTQAYNVNLAAQNSKTQYEDMMNKYFLLLLQANKLGSGQSAALSAKQIKEITGAIADGIYYIKCGNVIKKTYCLMDPKYDGGGWMLLMKMGVGGTFGFSSPHWTTATTLNENSLNITDISDSKFDVYNYTPIKDIMVIFYKDDVKGYTGGCINNDLGWCWLLNNWYDNGRSIEAMNGFNIPRDATPVNPYDYAGWNSELFSKQNGVAKHVIGGHGHYGNGWSGQKSDWGSTRWGFVFNNEGDMFSNDAWCGIGLGKTKSSSIVPSFVIPDRSAGDYYGCCGTEKLNKSVRCLLFGR